MIYLYDVMDKRPELGGLDALMQLWSGVDEERFTLIKAVGTRAMAYIDADGYDEALAVTRATQGWKTVSQAGLGARVAGVRMAGRVAEWRAKVDFDGSGDTAAILLLIPCPECVDGQSVNPLMWIVSCPLGRRGALTQEAFDSTAEEFVAALHLDGAREAVGALAPVASWSWTHERPVEA